MNKAELVNALASESGIAKKDADAFLNSFMTVVKGTLKEKNKVQLVGFGTFMTQERKATTGINPQTGKKMDIPAKTVAKMKFSDSINSMLN